jgi:hypothetical protein
VHGHIGHALYIFISIFQARANKNASPSQLALIERKQQIGLETCLICVGKEEHRRADNVCDNDDRPVSRADVLISAKQKPELISYINKEARALRDALLYRCYHLSSQKQKLTCLVRVERLPHVTAHDVHTP